MNLEGYEVSSANNGVRWPNTEDWHKVDTPARMLGDEIKTTYGKSVGTVAYVLFEDERDAIMFKLSLK